MRKIPQTVILAAGKSSRMFPFSDSHKSMIEIAGKPILQYVLEEVKKAGCKDVVIVVNQKDEDIREYFKNGKDLGLSIKYAVQKNPKGMGNALLSAKPYIKDTFFLVNTNHINLSQFFFQLQKAFTVKYDGVLLGSKTKEPSKYGIFKMKGDKILEIIEKPKKGKEPSHIKVVGLYLLSKSFLPVLQSTPQAEYQLEHALNKFFKKKKVRILLTSKETFSLKYPWDLFKIKEYFLSQMKPFISPKAEVSPKAILQGKVIVEKGAKILEGTIIKGPVYIGKNAMVGNHALVRNNTFLEEGVRIGAMSEIRNSLFMKNATFHSGFVGDSIVGEGTKIGAGFITANRRFDRKDIGTYVKKKKAITGRISLGTIIGKGVAIGIKCGTMPGVMIGAGSIVYPGTMVCKNTGEGVVIKDK
ncbi:bifunctional sugar-1-phosphate nucleotidylyltransferase/acetyltransferase [Patescibacteria group bacterium]